MTAVLLFINLSCARAQVPPASASAGKTDSEAPGVSVSQEKVNFSSPETWILGYFRPERLAVKPHSEWYLTGYDNYTYNEETVARLLNIDKSELTIRIVLGTWCVDSRREVPRFMRIITAINFPPEKIEFLGVDNNKFSPVAGYGDMAIERVPTFIFYLKNVEAGRIIENPVASLEQDMLNILDEKK